MTFYHGGQIFELDDKINKLVNPPGRTPLWLTFSCLPTAVFSLSALGRLLGCSWVAMQWGGSRGTFCPVFCEKVYLKMITDSLWFFFINLKKISLLNWGFLMAFSYRYIWFLLTSCPLVFLSLSFFSKYNFNWDRIKSLPPSFSSSPLFLFVCVWFQDLPLYIRQPVITVLGKG